MEPRFVLLQMSVSPASLARLYEEDFKQDMAALKVGGWREARVMDLVWGPPSMRGQGDLGSAPSRRFSRPLPTCG